MAPKPRTVPRKQPRQERSRATIDAILTATARILEREGFDRASTNRIAEAAGVSIGSLYQYFPSKEALVAALVERHIESMSRDLLAEMASVAQAPLAVAVRRMVELMLRAHAVDPRLHKVLVEQVPRVGRLERVHELEDTMTRVARAYLEAHRAEVRPRDLDLAAFVAVTTVEALTHAATLTRPDLVGEARFVDEVTDVVLRYLQK
jgi:AcrR family transcriptional regulator